MMNEANIMEIERFAIHDGPGIRTVVFIQGCPLHCPWCANPESQGGKPLLMHYPKKCIGCGSCASSCPDSLIDFRDGRPVFHRRDCTGCSVCVDVCLQNAIKRVGRRMSAEEVVEVVLRDNDYYRTSGGGVTFSGGEAAAHPDMLEKMLTKCRENGIHTAVETCGNVPARNYEKILPYVNLFLFDIKHLDPEKLKTVTGGDLDLILGNLRMLAGKGCEIVLRVPCIPGFNLEPGFFESFFSLATELGLQRIDLLPYHTLGKDKYTQLGLPYSCPEKSLDKKDLLEYKQAGEKSGLVITFG